MALNTGRRADMNFVILNAAFRENLFFIRLIQKQFIRRNIVGFENFEQCRSTY